MGIKLGNNNISTLKLGSSQVDKVYLGSNELWSNLVAYSVTLTNPDSAYENKRIYYKINDFSSAEQTLSPNATITINASIVYLYASKTPSIDGYSGGTYTGEGTYDDPYIFTPTQNGATFRMSDIN